MSLDKAAQINRLSERLNITKARAIEIIEAFTDIMTETLVQGDRVLLTNFGSLVVRRSAETRATYSPGGITPATNRVRFRPAKALKQKVQ